MLKETLQKKNSELQKVSLELYNSQKEISEYKQQKNNADIISQLSLNKDLSSSKKDKSSFSNTLENKNSITNNNKAYVGLYQVTTDSNIEFNASLVYNI